MSELLSLLYLERREEAEAHLASDMVRLLLDRDADVDGRRASGHPAHAEARVRGDQQLIDLLTIRGAT